VLSTPTGGTGTITFNATATTNLAAGNHTYTATDANGCSKSITVTINAAPDEITYCVPTQPKCFDEKIRSFKHANWRNGTYFLSLLLQLI
jgi:hypothetical protein